MLSKENVFKGPTNRHVPGACANLTSNRLLDLLIQFAENSRSVKMPFQRQNGTVKRGINGYQTLTFLTFFIIKNLWLYSRMKKKKFQI